MPGYTYCFVDNVPKRCICPICKLPMQSPVIVTSCQHAFCDSCLRPRRSNGRSSLDLDTRLMCPLDEQMMDQRNIHASAELREAIESCMVRCPQEPQGCRWVDFVKHVPSHMESCKYVAVPCPENCGDLICRGFLGDHVGHACPKRRRECQFCRSGFSAEDYQKHEGSCPEEQVWCENKCGQRMPRRRLARHMTDDCVKREVGCRFCRRRFHFDTLQVHIQQCTLKGGASSSAGHTPSSSQQSAPTVPYHQHQLQHQQHQQHQQQSYSASTTTSTNSSSNDGGATVDHRKVGPATPAIGVGVTVDATIDRGLQPQQQQHQQQQQHSPPPPVPRRAASAECLEGGGAPAGGGASRRSDCPLKWCGCQFKGDRPAIDRHLKEAATRHVTLLSELSRAQRRELDSLRRQLRHLPLIHDGHLVWRIDNYREKLAESRTNRELEFCSVPFYTGRPGYRLQASVFLNGNGAATDRCLSLYVKLLPGEFDPVLDWPFDRPIRMRLLDQSPARRHLQESFAPDATWRHFRRPVKEAGAFGFGFPRFASHETLREEDDDEGGGDGEALEGGGGGAGRRFVVDNAIFLEIEVLQAGR